MIMAKPIMRKRSNPGKKLKKSENWTIEERSESEFFELPELKKPIRKCEDCGKDVCLVESSMGLGGLVRTGILDQETDKAYCDECRFKNKRKLEKKTEKTKEIIYKFPCGRSAVIDKFDLEKFQAFGIIEACLHACPIKLDIHSCEDFGKAMDKHHLELEKEHQKNMNR